MPRQGAGAARRADVVAGSVKTTSSAKVEPAPSLSMLIGPAGISPSATAVEACFAGELFCAERDQVALVAKQRIVPQAAPRSVRRRR